MVLAHTHTKLMEKKSEVDFSGTSLTERRKLFFQVVQGFPRCLTGEYLQLPQ